MATHSGTSKRHAGLPASDTLSAHAAWRLAGMGRYNAKLWQVNTDGKRGEVSLTDTQRATILAYVRQCALPKDRVRFVDHTELHTAYGPSFDILHIGSDVMPGHMGSGTRTANSRLTWRGVVAHELIGHRERTMPANGDERAQVVPLLDAVKVRTGKRGRPRKRLKVIATDKGYDAKALRQKLRPRGIRAHLCLVSEKVSSVGGPLGAHGCVL